MESHASIFAGAQRPHRMVEASIAAIALINIPPQEPDAIDASSQMAPAFRSVAQSWKSNFCFRSFVPFSHETRHCRYLSIGLSMKRTISIDTNTLMIAAKTPE
jgi:hypothetical protein